MGIRVAYACNRAIGAEGLRILLSQGVRPAVLVLPEASAMDQVDTASALVPEAVVLQGRRFWEGTGLQALRDAQLDYLLSVHFPHLIPKEVLAVAKEGALNLHPAYLPYNRGWHTPSWAILDGTPYGATLHWMTEVVDAGDIAIRRRLVVSPGDTAHGLYQRVLALELEVLEAAVPLLKQRALGREAQEEGGTMHRRGDLLRPEVQRLGMDGTGGAGDLLRRLRALTTNRWEEAAYFEVDGRRYRVRVDIREVEG